MKFTENFLRAAEDYRFLLEKKYPGKAIHELVSTRYALNHVEHLEKALDLLWQYLDDCRVPKAILYLDNPLHLSGYFSREIDVKAESLKMEIEVVRDESPDHLIMKSSDGVVCTSDSVIIDKTARPVFDLARHILSNAFKKEIFSIERIQEKSK